MTQFRRWHRGKLPQVRERDGAPGRRRFLEGERGPRRNKAGFGRSATEAFRANLDRWHGLIEVLSGGMLTNNRGAAPSSKGMLDPVAKEADRRRRARPRLWS